MPKPDATASTNAEASARTAVPWPPRRLASDLWVVFNAGNPNDRYQRFLLGARPAIKQLIESLLLHPEIFVPTEDYLSLTVLVGTLGERAVLEMLDSGRLRFARVRGCLAYFGDGRGLKFFHSDHQNRPSPYGAVPEEAVAWALGGLEVPVKDPALARLAVKATLELAGADISNAIQRETYLDVLQSPYLRKHFAIPKRDMDRLPGIESNGVRLYGGRDEPRDGDEIDAVLAIGMANVELRLSELVGAADMATVSPVGHILKAKVERSKGREAADSFGELREIAGVPDIGEVILSQGTNIREVLKLAASRDGIAFQDWFHRNCRTDTIASAREYSTLLKAIPRAHSAPAKVIRFLITTAAGLIPGGMVAGPLASAFDSFVLDRIAREGSPKYFIEHLSQLAKDSEGSAGGPD